jgi:hypothetical protein
MPTTSYVCKKRNLSQRQYFFSEPRWLEPVGEMTCVIVPFLPWSVSIPRKLSMDKLRPHRWSTTVELTHMYGPAVRRKRFHRSGGFAVLHQCIRPLIGACCAPGHHGYQRACVLITGQASSGAKWVTRVRRRREDRSSISFYPLADLGRETGTMSSALS